jgi:O-antigen/teichoic acid export membrane protein
METGRPPPQGQSIDPEAEEALDSRVIRSSAWVALSFGGTRILSIVALIVLARLLTPADFGVVSLAAVFLLVFERIQGGGLYVALIHRRKELEEAVASAFLFAAAFGLALYAGIFLAAPALADVFRSPRLDEVMRVFGLVVVVHGFGLAPKALLARELGFRRLARGELGGGLAFVGLSIALAFAGFGVWSLVVGRLAEAVVRVSVNWFLAPPLPSLRRASRRVLRELVRYGRFVSGANLLNLVTAQLDTVLVGRLLGTTSLGFYSIAFRFASFPSGFLGAVAGRVMFPAYAMLQDDVPAFRRSYVTNLQRIALVGFPLSLTLVVAAEPLVLGLLGQRWEATIGPLRLLAVYGLLRSIAATAGPVFRAANRPHLDFLLTIPNALTIAPLVYFLTSSFDMVGAAIAMVVSLSTSAVPRFVVVLRVLRVAPAQIATALAGPTLCAGVLCASLLALLPVGDRLGTSGGLVLIVLGGTVAYLAAASVFARDVIRPVWLDLRRGRVRTAMTR